MSYLQKLHIYKNSSFQEMRNKEFKTAWKCDFFLVLGQFVSLQIMKNI